MKQISKSIFTTLDSVWTSELGFIVFCSLFTTTHAHGRLMEPPSRSSMWRLGYNTPPNYQDNELFCGGFQNQWEAQGGKCGVCGDPWQGPRENEAGGKYALGIITRRYRTNSQIPVVIQITAPHRGWFEFRLCVNNDVTKPATLACLDQHILVIANGTGTRYHVTFDYPMDYELLVQLPIGIKCSQCVFQWKYNAGNSWGVDETGRGCVGCGPQEQFHGCADIAIGDYTPSDLIPEHKYSPVDVKPPDTGRENYIDFKDAVDFIKNDRNNRDRKYGKKWWKLKEETTQENGTEAKILFGTLFKNGGLSFHNFFHVYAMVFLLLIQIICQV